MSKVEAVYDAIVTQVNAVLVPQNYVRLPNPYDVQANTFLHLRQGYGIEIGPGNNTERYVGCLSTWERTYTIILVRRVVTTENNTDVRVTIEKAIMDDHESLLKAFELNSSLGEVAIKTVVQSDGGINFLDVDRQKFLATSINLIVEYQFDPRN